MYVTDGAASEVRRGQPKKGIARQVAAGYPVLNEAGGERGIRTLGAAFTTHSLSRRAPSAGSAISP